MSEVINMGSTESKQEMKYKIIVSPNLSAEPIECVDYEIMDKGILFYTEKSSRPFPDEHAENPVWIDFSKRGFLPHGSYGAILPL